METDEDDEEQEEEEQEEEEQEDSDNEDEKEQKARLIGCMQIWRDKERGTYISKRGEKQVRMIR